MTNNTFSDALLESSQPMVIAAQQAEAANDGTIMSPYQRLSLDDEAASTTTNDSNRGRNEILNFVWMSVLFSANHGCVVACLSLATAQLGSVGAWQSGILYLTYTASALLGSTYIVKALGSRDALILGMSTYCFYVGCFWIATIFHDNPSGQMISAYVGAAVGGVGAGLIWVAQGVYYSRSAEVYADAQLQSNNNNAVSSTTCATTTSDTNSNNESATEPGATTTLAGGNNNSSNNDNEYTTMIQQQQQQQQQHEEEVGEQGLLQQTQQQQQQPSLTDLLSKSNSKFAAIFAFVYLSEEVALKALSSFLLQEIGLMWTQVFAVYTIISILATILMLTVRKDDNKDNNNNTSQDTTTNNSAVVATISSKVLAAWNLLVCNPKMKYMIGCNMIFGFTSAYLNSYVNGEVIQLVLNDQNSKYVGVISSWVPITAAIMSVTFNRIAPRGGRKNGVILTIGMISFMIVVLPFIIIPPPASSSSPYKGNDGNAKYWGWTLLLTIFTFHGIGRSTFESTLKATFADFFPDEKEGAFANIILQNGLSSAIGFVLTFNLLCPIPSKYCVQFRDGTYHDVLSFELLVIAAGIVGIIGYWRASYLHYQSSSTLP